MKFDPDLQTRVRQRLDNLTKPQGSLGRLEEVALRFASIRGDDMPSCARRGMFVFCGDHGVTAEGVSAYPQAVTAQMMKNFVDGGAAISVLCRSLHIKPVIVDMGSCGPVMPLVLDRKISFGTKNFAKEPAMSREEAEKALSFGQALAVEAADEYDIAGMGDMGIGNTSSASAILSVYSGREPHETVGAGAGLDAEGVLRKIEVIAHALRLHKPRPDDGIGVLAAVGGFELGGIAGFLIAASRLSLPVVLDGFPCCSAALIARAIDPNSLDSAFFAHVSQEPGHRLMLDLLEARPLFDLGLRLGEGSGAALGIGLIDSAVRLYREMATFSGAGVSTRS